MARSPRWTCETCGFETDSNAEAKEHVDENDGASIVDTEYDPGITPVGTSSGWEAH